MILYYILVPLAWLVFLIGFRVRCEGRENLKKIGTKGCIIAPNHISAIDPVFVVIARFWGQRMTVFAKKELFEINAFLSWFFRCAGAVLSLIHISFRARMRMPPTPCRLLRRKTVRMWISRWTERRGTIGSNRKPRA